MKPGFGHTDPTTLGLKAVPPVCPDFQLKAPCRSPEAHGQALDTWRERAGSGHTRVSQHSARTLASTQA